MYEDLGILTASPEIGADLTDLFCTAERCPMIVGNTLVFRDDNHVTTQYAQLLAPVLGALADEAITEG